MTGWRAARDVTFPAVIPNGSLPCHSERPHTVSFRTVFSLVIPNGSLPCHSERSEESAVGNTAGDSAKFEEIPRRYAPRNDRMGARNDRMDSSE
jgi:hypothetical protein